jgi:hypothetical protein
MHPPPVVGDVRVQVLEGCLKLKTEQDLGAQIRRRDSSSAILSLRSTSVVLATFNR